MEKLGIFKNFIYGVVTVLDSNTWTFIKLYSLNKSIIDLFSGFG